MNKKLIWIAVTVFGALGAYVPVLFGDTELLSGWSILGSFVGGLVGVWVGAYLSKRYS